MKIAHLTSAHPRYDARIFLKECRSLAASGHRVTLIVADGLPDEERDQVRIFGVARPNGRLRRMLATTRAVFERAVREDADLYHLHDPELLTIALKLKKLGKRVVFDSHEDVPRQILSKHYLWKPVRGLVSRMAAVYEARVCARIDAVVAATPYIRDKFLRINPRTIDVNNYPMLDELHPPQPEEDRARAAACYIGGISSVRGIVELVCAMEYVSSGLRLAIAGNYIEPGLYDSLRRMPGWQRCDDLGWQTREGVRNVLQRSRVGMVTLHPTPAYLQSLPVKMFEYMGAGIPVIASDFPLWKEIVGGSDCGLCVDPLKPEAIAEAIDWIAAHPAEAARMGENGRKAVEERYNWQAEARKLAALYAGLD